MREWGGEGMQNSMEQLNFEEINAILDHKWYLSEKECRDVGMEYAINDFFRNHAASWRKKKMEQDYHLQKEEILRHKWYLSEKLRREVSTTEAALDWVSSGYAEHWRNKTGPYKDRETKPEPLSQTDLNSD